MLKRLIFAVFVLGIFLTLSGTAISDIGKKEGLNSIRTTNVDAQFYGQQDDGRPVMPSFKKPESAFREVQMSGVAASPPSTYFCELDYYYDDTATAVWVWTIPDAYGDDLFNTRFTVDEGLQECTLKVSWLLMYGGYTAGTPDMRIYLWDDDGFGFPGNKLDSVDIPNAVIAPNTSFYWVSADWSAANWVFGELEEYHVGWTTLGDGVNDVLCGVSDKATGPYLGEERSSENWNGYWGSMLNDWGDDAVFLIESERCCFEKPYSDCYPQSYDEGTAYFWQAPHPAYGITDWYERFSVSGPETLTTVDFAIYNFEGASSQGAGIVGNDDIYVTVYADDGTGLPGAVLGTKTVTAGTYAFYPAYEQVDFKADNLVFTSDFFIGLSSSGDFSAGDYECFLSDDETTPSGRGYANYGGPMPMMDLYGLDVDFKITASMCIDPYSDCSWNWSYVSLDYFWNLPDAWGDYASAQKMTAIGEDCQVLTVDWALYNFGDYGVDASYTYNSVATVYNDIGGYPGSLLGSVTITPAEYVLYPGVQVVDFSGEDIFVVGDYWVAIESQAPTEAEGIATLTDFGGGGNDYGAAEGWGVWGFLTDDWSGVPTDIAFIVDAYHCCVPFDERFCGDPPGGEDWATLSHDQARTGASFNPVYDAQCDMNQVWQYAHPTQQAFFSNPIIAGDKVACTFTNELAVFDLATGTPTWSFSGFPMGSQVRCAPTVTIIDILGTPTEVVYVSGGDQESIMCLDWATGALIWSRDVGTVTPMGLYGQTRFSTFTVLGDVVYWGTDGGAVVAAEAATGNLYAGWATNPVELGQGLGKSGTTDGSNLYFCSYPGGVEGDVWSIDAATGNINWTLSGAGGLQANTVFPEGPQTGEGFTGGLSWENGILYANSRLADATYPGDGVLYAINTGDGSIKYAVPSARTMYGTPVIDANRIYVGAYSSWVTPPIGGNLLAFNKSSGGVLWTAATPNDDNYYNDLVLTCEPDGAPDLIFAGGHKGFMSVMNSVDGDEIYRRRIDYGPPFNSMWNGGAITEGGIMAFSTFFGSLHVMAKGEDRPRLEILSYNPEIGIEFGALPSLPTSLGPMLTNTGCADLTINDLLVDITANDNYIPEYSIANVRDDVMDNATTIADRMTTSFKASPPEYDWDEMTTVRQRGEITMNAGADVLPNFLNDPPIISPVDGAILAPGDTTDIVVDVIQGMILRGPQYFYIEVDTDDPDYFMNAGFVNVDIPAISVTLVGGCLSTATLLEFGMGCANYHYTFNTGLLVDGDIYADGFSIDGMDAVNFQGSYVFGVDTYRIATAAPDWRGRDGSHKSMQADPNYFDDECVPALVEDAPLGTFHTTDGFTYTELVGNIVYKSYVDSVQNFDDGGGWDWTWYDAMFDDTLSMGIYTNTRTVGVCDFPELNNVIVEVMEFTERNGDSIPDWKFGAIIDYDIGTDTADIDRSISTAWAYTAGGAGDIAWGQVKLPFGCGYNPGTTFEPLKNVYAINADQALWGDFFWDSAYYYMTLPPGAYGHSNVSGGGDQEYFATYAEHDFGGNETFTIGVVNFGFDGLTDVADGATYAGMANFVNQFAGFGRGDVNNDGAINLADIMYLNNYVVFSGPGPIPFLHLGDVNNDGLTDAADVTYLLDFYFVDGECPVGDWMF